MLSIIALFIWWNAANAFYGGDTETAGFLLASAVLFTLVDIAWVKKVFPK